MIGLDSKQSIYQAWKKNNGEFFDTQAMEYFGNKWSFRETDDMITVYARALRKMGIGTKSTVTFCAPAVPSVLVAFMAVNKIGARASFVSPQVLAFNGPEYLDKPESEILFVLDKFYPAVAESVARTGVKKIVAVSFADNAEVVSERLPEKLRYVMTNDDFKEITKASPDADKLMRLRDFVALGKGDGVVQEKYEPGATAVILYTGGSTGIPKGVERTNEATISMVRVLTSEELRMGDLRGMRNGIFIPPNHPTSFVHSIVAPWILGTVEVLQPFYNKDTFVHDLYALKVGYAIGAPSHYAMFLHADLPDGALSHLVLPFCGGESISYELAAGINKEFTRLGVQNPLIVCYGMSEIGPTVTMSIGDTSLVNKPGRLLPGVKGRIRADSGKIVGVGERGILEVDVNSAGIAMKGYFLQPELTDAFWTEDGYAVTGDIVTRDKDGNYEMLGRASDCFVDNRGVTRYLFDIENLAYKDKDLAEVEASRLIISDGAVQVPVVHIVLRNDDEGRATVILKQVQKYLQDKLPKAMWPRGYRFVDSFPTNLISGKRDYMAMSMIRDGYHVVEEGKVYEVEFPERGEVRTKIVEKVVVHRKK